MYLLFVLITELIDDAESIAVIMVFQKILWPLLVYALPANELLPVTNHVFSESRCNKSKLHTSLVVHSDLFS